MNGKKIAKSQIDPTAVTYDEHGNAIFTKEMKKDYLLLVPTLLPIHFGLLKELFTSFGYNVEVLPESDDHVAQTGLKYLQNDICYPAILVIGELLEAVFSGKYDPHKIALVISQSGGGCRASNYLFLLQKALKKAGYGYIPVLSFNFSELAKQPGFCFSVGQYYQMVKCLLYGDLLMLLKNQCAPYELTTGATDKLVADWTARLGQNLSKNLNYRQMKRNYRQILDDFAAIPRQVTPKVKVGIVGEIFVKYSPLGNHNLEKFLIKEGAEVYVPGLLDFILYCFYNNTVDSKFYGMKKLTGVVSHFIYRILSGKERDMIKIIKQHGVFLPPADFRQTVKLRAGYISEGVKMGEGWLLTAEMVELIERGFGNIVCTQPFGCLPNHIAGKGVMKTLRDRHPEANIVAIDYDASTSHVNQENRLKLMLANAKERLAPQA